MGASSVALPAEEPPWEIRPSLSVRRNGPGPGRRPKQSGAPKEWKKDAGQNNSTWKKDAGQKNSTLCAVREEKGYARYRGALTTAQSRRRLSNALIQGNGAALPFFICMCLPATCILQVRPGRERKPRAPGGRAPLPALPRVGMSPQGASQEATPADVTTLPRRNVTWDFLPGKNPIGTKGETFCLPSTSSFVRAA